VAGVFAAGFAGDDGGGWDADEGGCDCCNCCVQSEVRGMECFGGCDPEDQRGDAAVGTRAWFEQACSEEGGDEPGQEGLFLGWRVKLDVGVGHEGLV